MKSRSVWQPEKATACVEHPGVVRSDKTPIIREIALSMRPPYSRNTPTLIPLPKTVTLGLVQQRTLESES